MKYIMLFLVIVFFGGCSSKEVLWTNPSIPDYNQRKAKFEEDKTTCAVLALRALPIQNTPTYNNNRGSFEITNLNTGTRYEGTYRSGGGFANAVARGAAMARASRMDELRKNLYEICMKKRGWKKVIVTKESPISQLMNKER